MTTALDVHEGYVAVLRETPDGTELPLERFATDLESVMDYAARLPKGEAVLLEACYGWEHIYDAFVAAGHAVHVLDPASLVEGKKRKRKKTDLEDLRNMLRKWRAKDTVEVIVAPRDTRDRRDIVRLVRFLTQERTSVKNRVHVALTKEGVKVDASDLFGKTGRKAMEVAPLRPVVRIEVTALLSVIDQLDQQIGALRGQIALDSKEDEQVRDLMAIPGISEFMATLMVTETGSFERFPTARHYASYTGLVPSVHQSGQTDRTGHITREGNRHLRWAYVEAVQKHVTGCNVQSAIKEKYEELAPRTGKMKAKVACANKMARTVWGVLVRKTAYRDADEERHREKLRLMAKRAVAYPATDPETARRRAEELIHEEG